MKKRIYLFLFLLPTILILGGCGQKVAVNNAAPVAQNPVAQNPVAQNNAAADKGKSETTKMSASAKEMMQSGKSLDCTFSFTDAQQGVAQSGEFYVDGPKARFRSEIEMTTISTGQKTKAYMITDGDYGYSWNSTNAKMGFKINLNEAPSAENTDKNVQKTEDLNQPFDFNCRDWSVDNSKFILPAGVEFTDINQMMKSLSVPTKTTDITACSICDQIPDAKIKAECQKTSCK